MRTTSRLLVAGSLSALALASTTAAQNVATAATPVATAGGVEEIIVTAQRQSQSLQDVPIAVSAFTGATLARQNITNTTLLQQQLPNITFTKTNYTSSNFAIRGVGNTAVGTSIDSGVGVAFNEMPLFSPLLFETEYFDLDRIEVLRGPQGTLFGRNATSGVIDVITKKPDSHLGAGAELEYGNYNSRKVTGDINIPLSSLGIGQDLGGFRVAGLYLKRDGFTTNLFDNSKIDGRNLYSVRASLRLTLGSDTTIDLVGSYFSENDNRSRSQKQLCHRDPTGILGCLPDRLAAEPINSNAFFANVLTSKEFLALNKFGPAAGLLSLNSVYGQDTYSGAIVPTDLRTVDAQYNPTYSASEKVFEVHIEHRFGKTTLNVIGGYSESGNSGRVDYNLVVPNAINPAIPGTVQAIFGKSAPLFQNGQICVSEVNSNLVGYIGNQINRCSNNPLQYDQSAFRSQQYNLEAHLDSHFDGPLNFLIGANYLHGKTALDYEVATSYGDYASLLLTGPTPANGINTGLASPYFANNTPRYTLDAYAGFGELYYKFADKVKLTVGARYTIGKKRSIDDYPQPLLALGPVPFGTQSIANLVTFRDARLTNKAVTGRGVLDWKPELSFTDSTLVYASYSRGYKAGGINPAFNPAIFQAPTTVGPEHINAYEVGTKNRFGGGVFQANLTGFFYDYKGLQISRILNRTSFNDNTNAEVYGAEGEFVIAPVKALLVNITASYLHTRIKNLSLSDSRDPSAGRSDVVVIKDITSAANCVVAPTIPQASAAGAAGLVNAVNAGINAATKAGLQNAVPLPATNAYGAFSICSSLAGAIKGGNLPFQYFTSPNGSVNLPDGIAVDLSGRQLPNSPAVKVSAGAQYTFGLPLDWNAVLHGDVSLTGTQYGRSYNDFADRIPAYEIVNAQLQFNSPDERLYLRAFVTNAFNTQAVTGLFVNDATSALFTNVFTVEPRRFGLGIGAKF